MAANYPGAVSALVNPAPTTQMNAAGATGHSAQHINANDEIDAITAELGINARGGAATVSGRILALEGALGTSTEVLHYMGGL